MCSAPLSKFAELLWGFEIFDRFRPCNRTINNEIVAFSGDEIDNANIKGNF